MANFTEVLQQLRVELARRRSQVESLNAAISALESLATRSGTFVAVHHGTKPKRIVTAAARAKMRAAQRARRLRERGRVSLITRTKTSGTRTKPTISAAGRKRIAAAAKARWARFRALRAKAAKAKW